MRAEHLLTATAQPGALHAQLEIEPTDAPAPAPAKAFAGLLLGIGNAVIDYRLAALVRPPQSS